MRDIQLLNQSETITLLTKHRVIFKSRKKERFFQLLQSETLAVVEAYYKIYKSEYDFFMGTVRKLSLKQIERNVVLINNIHHLYINMFGKIYKIKKSKMDKPTRGVLTEIPYDRDMARQKVNLVDLYRAHYETWDLSEFVKISADDTITQNDWLKIKNNDELINNSEVA